MIANHGALRYLRRWALVLSLAISLLILNACAVSDSRSGKAETVELQVADYLPKSDYHTEHGLKIFMEEAESLSNGKITFEHYPAEQLAAAEDLLNAASSGMADITLVGVPYNDAELPLAGVCALPGTFDSVSQGTRACWEVTQGSHVQDEYLDNGVRPLYATVNEPYGLQTRGVKVTSTEDLDGLKLRTSGGDMSKLVTSLGATPVEMSGPETVEAVQRGTVDGALYPVLSLVSYELGGPLDYGYTGVNLGSFSHTAVINDDTWQDLSEDQQQVLRDAGQKAMKDYVAWVDKNQGAVIDRYEREGEMEFRELPADVVEEWKRHTDTITEQWVASMTEDGLPGDEVWRTWTEAIGGRGQQESSK